MSKDEVLSQTFHIKNNTLIIKDVDNEIVHLDLMNIKDCSDSGASKIIKCSLYNSEKYSGIKIHYTHNDWVLISCIPCILDSSFSGEFFSELILLCFLTDENSRYSFTVSCEEDIILAIEKMKQYINNLYRNVT